MFHNPFTETGRDLWTAN